MLRLPPFSTSALLKQWTRNMSRRPIADTISRPQSFPSDWHKRFSYNDIPSEADIDPPERFPPTGIDTRALVFAATSALGASSLPQIMREEHGGWNKVYNIRFSDDISVIARIPASGPRRSSRSIESQVALMTFARYCLGIPAPTVFAWNPSYHNPVGAPYILMEFVEGKEPWEIWDTSSHDQRLIILDNLARWHARFSLPLSLKGSGSLYFKPTAADATLDPTSVSSYWLGPLELGPNCPDLRPNPTSPMSAPNLSSFWKERIRLEREDVQRRWGSDPSRNIIEGDEALVRATRLCTMGEFLQLSSRLESIVDHYVMPKEYIDPCIALGDFAFRNMLLDPVTLEFKAFLDWDDMSILPFLLNTRYPEDISSVWGAPEAWRLQGGFDFLPPDEIPNTLPLRSGDEPEWRQERITHTQYRQYYARRLKENDGRFSGKLWEAREEALKIHYCVTHGLTAYVAKSLWIKAHI